MGNLTDVISSWEDRRMNLKSCPFCGEKDLIKVYGEKYQYIKCNTCKARGPRFMYSRLSLDESAWNTRQGDNDES